MSRYTASIIHQEEEEIHRKYTKKIDYFDEKIKEFENKTIDEFTFVKKACYRDMPARI